MASPSVAVLSALVAATGRPLRLLLEDGVPSFVPNIGRIAGAAPLHAPLADIEGLLQAVLETEGVGPDNVWGVAAHRDGQVSPFDWLTICGARGIPTIDLCLGSLAALAERGPSPATFTIVDLDAEGMLEGVHLTALLTDNGALADRVRALCLPGPGEPDYVLDAAPRGLEDDEPLLAGVVERAISQFAQAGVDAGAEGSATALDRSVFGLAWIRRFGTSGQAESPSPEGAAPGGASLWRARQAEAAATSAPTPDALQRRLDQLKIIAEEWQTSQATEIAAVRSESRRKIEELQAALDQSESRVRALESEASIEASRVAALVSRHQEETQALELSVAGAKDRETELLAQKAELEETLLAVRDDGETLARKLARVERERDLAVIDAANREESERRGLAEHRLQVEDLEKAIAASTEREARLAATSEAARAELSARIVRLEADAVVFGKARTDLLAQKSALEATLLAVRGESESLARKLAQVEKERDSAAAQAAEREESERVRIGEHRLQVGDLEKARADLSARIVRLEADAVVGVKARTDLQAQKTELEAALLAVRAEGETLARTLFQVKKERDLVARGVADLGAQRSELERTLLAVRAEGETLAKTLVQVEKERDLAARSVAELGVQKSELERTLLALRGEGESLAKTLARTERERDLAVRDAANREEAERRGVAENRLRVEEFEKAIAAAAEREAGLSREWEASRADLAGRIARLEADAAAGEEARAALLAEKTAAQAAISAFETEGEAMLEKLAQVKRDRDQAMADAANRDWTLRSQLGEERHRADELAKEVEGLKDRAARLEADLSAGSAALAEAQGRAARLDEGLRAVVDREVKQSREWELARADLSERIERLEAARLNAEKAHQEVLALKDQGERALLSLQAQSEGLVRKLTEAESGRDAALAKAARQEQVHQEVNRADRDELKRRVEDLQNERSELADRIARLERAAVVAENMQADLRSQKAESERALSTARAELETLIRKLADAETDRDRARAKIAKSEEALRAAFEEEKLQAEQKLQTALKDREEQLSGEWVVSRSDLSNRIARLEAAAVAAENAHQELLDQKAESERALAEVRAEAEGLARKLAAAESDRDRARAEVAKSEEVVLAAFQEQRQRTEEFERHEAELKDRLSGQFVVSRTELSDRISRLEAAAAAEEDTRKQLLAEKAQLEQSLDSFRSDNLELARKLAAAVQERDRFQAAAQAGTGLEAVLGATGGEGSALQGAESEAGSAAFEAERQTLVARLAEAQEQRDQALAEAARRDAARQAEIAAQRQRAAELESRIAVAIEREAKQSAAWSAAQAEWSARVARLEADEVIADRARTELVNRKKESDRVLAALQAQKEALARRLDAVEKARDQARATVAKYEEAHEELIVSGASLEHWRARFKRTLPEAEGHSSRNTGPLSTLVKGWATAATQGPYRRRLSADQPSTEAGESDIDHTGVLDEIAASASPNPPATTAPVEPSPGETEPEPPPLTVRPSSIERLRPSPPAGQGAPKKDDEADRSGRWLSGLANRIRRGPKDPE